MASGKFKLYYRDVAGNPHACDNVQYDVLNLTSNTTVASGLTNQHGETAEFTADVWTSFALRVRQPDGKYKSPSTPFDEDGDSTLTLKRSADPARPAPLVTQKVRLRPYVRVRMCRQRDDAPIPNAKYKGYMIDKSGREVVARSLFTEKLIEGTTDAQGYTEVFGFNEPIKFKFFVPRTGLNVSTEMLQPLIEGRQPHFHRCAFKTMQAVTQPNTGHEVKVSGKTTAPFMINPDADELIMVPHKDFEEFERISGLLEATMAGLHAAKLDLSHALEAKSAEEIKKAEEALGLAEDRVKTALNKDFKSVADLTEVMVFESYNKGGQQGMGLRRRYLPTKKYRDLWNKRINKERYKTNLKIKGAAGPVSGSLDPKQLDFKSFKDALAQIKFSVKAEADPKVLDLFDWAGNQYADAVRHSDSFETESAAQWMRFVGGAGASAEGSWKDKRVQVQGNLQGKLVVCEGKYTARWGVPSLNGWMMSLAGEDLGAVRAMVQVELYGFVGAKAALTGTLSVNFKGGKAVVQPTARDPNDSVAAAVDPKWKLPKFDPVGLNEKISKDANGVALNVDAFAGIEGGCTPSGALQWLPPQKGEFVSFAELTLSAGGSAGLGGKAQMNIYYQDGKFRIKVAARLCFGLGAKGEVDFAVNADKLTEFVMWLHNQLLLAGFKYLVYIQAAAFEALSQLLFMFIADDTAVGKRLKTGVEDIKADYERTLRAIEQADTRSQIVERIRSQKHWLLYATPETKGMLLYQITRHSGHSHWLDWPSPRGIGSGHGAQLHYLDKHKEAVIVVLSSVQLISEWTNVMQHMTRDGSKARGQERENELHLIRFLNYGLSVASEKMIELIVRARDGDAIFPLHTGNVFLDQYVEKRRSLLHVFPKGYQLDYQGSPQWLLYATKNGRVHPEFGLARLDHGWNDADISGESSSRTLQA